MTRIEALAKHLGITLEEGESYDDYLTDSVYGSDNELDYGRQSYLVLTDEEATKKAIEYVTDSLWAFNADFLASETDLPEEVFSVLQEKLSEGANDTFKTLVREHCSQGIEGFAKEAISSDGRAHFLNTYDGHEYEEGEFYIYRVN